MSVRRNKRDGKWVVDVVFEHADGRVERVRKVSPVQTRVGAQEHERQLRAALLDPRPKQKEVIKLATFIDERWWKTYPASVGNRETTIREKEIHLRKHIKPHLGELALDEVKGEPVARFFAALRDAQLKPKTIKNVRATLHTLLRSAVEWGELDAMPKLPKVKVPDPVWDHFTAPECEKLLLAARNPEERALLMFAIRTGLMFAIRTGARAGEQIALEWGDLDFNSNFVTFRRSSTRGNVGPTKSGRERRVPLSEKLRDALLAHRHLRGPLVFCNPDGAPLTLWQLHERLWATCRRAGLRKIRWHDLRHTFASLLVGANVPLRQVQAWLGRSSLALVQRYGHLAPHGNVDLINVVDAGCHGSMAATAR